MHKEFMSLNGMFSGIKLSGHQTKMHLCGFNVQFRFIFIVICLTVSIQTLETQAIISTLEYCPEEQLRIFKLQHLTLVLEMSV